MNRRTFLTNSAKASAAMHLSLASISRFGVADVDTATPRVTVMVVDTDRVIAPIDDRIYGQFLEHINHSVVDGLFAEQIRGAGFEGDDFKTYWESFSDGGTVEIVDAAFQNGSKSVRLRVDGGRAGIRQGRLFVDKGVRYSGSLWVQRGQGSAQVTLRVLESNGEVIASIPLTIAATGWQEIPFSFVSDRRDTQGSIEIAAAGHGWVLIDFISMMAEDARRNGMLRRDLFDALRGLRPSFIRWPGGSFASTYKWKDGIGPQAGRVYHPNPVWGGYSDYYGFGTDEFLGLCHRLGAEPLVVLPAQGTKGDEVEYAMEWVHYLNDPPSTEWGELRAKNGHPEPYNVRLFQIDNEPMNNGFTPESYAEIVNVYGRRLRSLEPRAQIVACGQKRSSDMAWSEKVIDLAGDNFDVLGCHNYEYEPQNFATGIERIGNYLAKLCEYVRSSNHPHIKVGVLEWSLQHTYDWRAGLHAAGSLILFEELSPGLTMACPALLMRNTTDDPRWTASIYHDHVSWFPGASYIVQKLFREHFASRYLASATGTVLDISDRSRLFDKISTQIPEGWEPGSVDAIATADADSRRVVIKAVNYQAQRNTLLVRLQGAAIPERATVTLHTVSAGLLESASLEHPDAIAPVKRTMKFARDLSIELESHTVAVAVIEAD